MNRILSTTHFVVENAKHVKIKKSRIKEFCDNFSESHINHWLNESPFNLNKLDHDQKLHFLLIFNSISFSYLGKPKWTIKYNDESFDGAWGMIAALGKSIERKIPILSMDYISKISKVDFEKILKGNVTIPLFDERLKILRELGTIIQTKYNGDFSQLVKASNSD